MHFCQISCFMYLRASPHRQPYRAADALLCLKLFCCTASRTIIHQQLIWLHGRKINSGNLHKALQYRALFTNAIKDFTVQRQCFMLTLSRGDVIISGLWNIWMNCHITEICRWYGVVSVPVSNVIYAYVMAELTKVNTLRSHRNMCCLQSYMKMWVRNNTRHISNIDEHF